MRGSMISVVIPAYNEEYTLGGVIRKTTLTMNNMKMPYEIIVVDDGSSDCTKDVAALCEASVLSNGQNKGKGHALRIGFEHARGDIIVTMDSDGSHHPEEIPHLVKPLFDGIDITAGSRFLGNGKHFTTRLNCLGNSLFNIAILILTGKRVTDSQTGFRAFKKDMLQHVRLESEGYDIETELTVKGLRNGFRFKEVPISCKRRKYDRSRLRILSDGMEILRAILKSSFAAVK